MIVIYYLIIYLGKCEAFWNFQELVNKYIPFSHRDFNEKQIVNTKELKEICDESQIILQLARLYATSPERIILLSTNSLSSKTCQDVADVLTHINDTISDCVPLQPDNLYKKLINALDFFNSYYCLYNPTKKDNHLIKYLPCLSELREDLLDCEGPPDWFEKCNEDVVCQWYNDIINCNYIKAAMLCGLKPAFMLRTFSIEVMKIIVKFKCKIPRSLPYIDDPMPARARHMKYISKFNFIHMLSIQNLCAYLCTIFCLCT